jgi:hypothetical protein
MSMVENTNAVDVKPQGGELLTRHARLLRQFHSVAGALRGVTSLLWLPGPGQQFEGPRRIIGTRPLVVTLEVADNGGLTLSGAVSRVRKGALAYRTMFRYEFTMPMVTKKAGAALSIRNEVLARRALGLLSALVDFGERRHYQPKSARVREPLHPRLLVPFNTGEEQFDEAKLSELAQESAPPELWEMYRSKLRNEMSDSNTLPGTTLVDARVVEDGIVAQAIARELAYEDYAPVLGIPQRNPIEELHVMANPAAALLSRHGVETIDGMDQATLDKVVTAFRITVPLGERLADDEVFDALVSPNRPVRCARGVDGLPAKRVIAAMRRVAGRSRAAVEGTDEDFLRAANNPREPLFLSRLSKTQIVATEALHDLPAPYCGHFIPAPSWNA